jgi:hypothetical protein
MEFVWIGYGLIRNCVNFMKCMYGFVMVCLRIVYAFNKTLCGFIWIRCGLLRGHQVSSGDLVAEKQLKEGLAVIASHMQTEWATPSQTHWYT